MMQNRKDKYRWNDLMKDAYSKLKNPESFSKIESLNNYHYKYRVWHYPSFETHFSWFIYLRDKKNKIREVGWNIKSESERINNPIKFAANLGDFSANFEIDNLLEHSEKIAELLCKLVEISIPIFVKTNSIGLDGETFGIEKVDPFCGASVQWWCNAPSEFRELEAWHEGFRYEMIKSRKG